MYFQFIPQAVLNFGTQIFGPVGIEPDKLYDIGTIDIGRLKKAVMKDEKASIPKWLSGALSEAKRKYENTKDPGIIDMIMDKAHLAHLREIVSLNESTFLKDLYRAEVDLYNIRTFIRIEAKKLGKDKLVLAIAEGGTKSPSFYIDLSGSSNEEIISSFKNTPYGKCI